MSTIMPKKYNPFTGLLGDRPIYNEKQVKFEALSISLHKQKGACGKYGGLYVANA